MVWEAHTWPSRNFLIETRPMSNAKMSLTCTMAHESSLFSQGFCYEFKNSRYQANGV